MKIIFITLSATLGIVGVLVSFLFWGNNFMSGGYNAFSALDGWFWPLLVSILLCGALIVGFKSRSGFNFKFKEVFFKILLPFAIGAVSILGIIFLAIHLHNYFS